MKDQIASMLRVNQAGEYGAIRIYKGQLSVLKGTAHADALKKMYDEEARHLKYFNDLIIQEKVRPTLLQPLWHIGGYALGVVTGLMGEKAAHACTIAVEEVIEKHYQDQLETLGSEEQELQDIIKECQADEVAHKEYAKELGGEDAPFYPFLSGAIRSITKTAIWLSKRI